MYDVNATYTEFVSRQPTFCDRNFEVLEYNMQKKGTLSSRGNAQSAQCYNSYVHTNARGKELITAK